MAARTASRGPSFDPPTSDHSSRDFEHRVGTDRVDGSVLSGEAEEELDIERPPTAERFAQRRPQSGRRSEKDLGPALGVVHLQSEHQAARRGEDAAEVVAGG